MPAPTRYLLAEAIKGREILDAPPAVKATRSGTGWAIVCPYCHSYHYHAKLGQHMAPCQMGQYIAYKRGQKSKAPPPITLRRKAADSRYLEFDPPQLCRCGGTLAVQDHCPPHVPGHIPPKSGRYECFCVKCRTCDPNGWRTRAEVIANSPAYFKA